MFNNLIIAYLFLGGFGAGAFILTVVLGWLPLTWFGVRDPFRDTQLRDLHEQIGLVVALGALGLGMVALFFDLGSRAFRFYFALNGLGTSWLSNGALSLALLALFGLVLLLQKTGFLSLSHIIITVVKVLSLLAAIFVMLYTGAFLYSMGNAIPLWNTIALPALFCLSSLSCGVAVHILIAVYYKTPDHSGIERFLNRSEVIILAVELLVAGIFAWLAYGPQLFTPEPTATFASDKFGSQLFLAFDPSLPQFFYAYLLVGLAIPLIAGIAEWATSNNQSNSKKLKSFAAVCILVGAFCLRFAVVTDAYHPSFYSSQEKLTTQNPSESSLGYSEISSAETQDGEDVSSKTASERIVFQAQQQQLATVVNPPSDFVKKGV